MENIRHMVESIKTDCTRDSGVKAPQVSSFLQKPKTNNNPQLVRQTSQNSGMKTPDKDGNFYIMWVHDFMN